MSANAEIEKRWIIRGIYPKGQKLAASVLAFDYAEAKRKAELIKGGAKLSCMSQRENSFNHTRK